MHLAMTNGQLEIATTNEATAAVVKTPHIGIRAEMCDTAFQNAGLQTGILKHWRDMPPARQRWKKN